MAVTKKTLFAENLDRYNTFVQDTNPTSRYFNITELPDTFTGGKNAFLIAGSNELVADTLIKIEIKDAAGEIIYYEPGEGYLLTNINGESFPVEYYEGVSKVVAVYVYPDTTAYGPCTITILGELSNYYDDNGLLSPIPLEWQGTYNVKWQKKVNVNPTLANTTKVRFYRRPSVSITENLESIYRIENGIKVNSGISQSFANVTVSNINTFAGDVKRVKVYRTSQGDISDYDLIQDILVESKELLTSYELSGSVISSAGFFTSEVLEKLWTESPAMYATLNSTKVDNGVRLVATNNSAKFIYTSSLNLSQNSVYELGIDAVYASATTSSNMNIYISGSNNGEVLIGALEGIVPTKNLKDSIFQFSLPLSEPTASFYLTASGSSDGTWDIGNLSLRLSEDTAFSPDEVSFITSMPTVIGNETYNFKFEFYDVNNNYVPVAVTASATFTGGNDNIGGTLIYISSSASSSLAQLNAVSSSISGTMTVYSSSASGSILNLSSSVSTSVLLLTGSISSSLSSSIGYASGSIYTLSGSISSSITTLSSSLSQSVYQGLLTSFNKVQDLANGNYSGSYISGNIIYAPVIGGQLGYFSTLFKVGQSPNSIYLDARQTPRKIFIGGAVPGGGDTEYSGAYNNSNTSVYLDSSGKFSLGNKLSYDGSTLSVTGQINIEAGGNAATTTLVSTAAGNAVTSGSNAASTAQSNAQSFAATAANNAVASGSAYAAAVDAKVFTDSTGKLARTPSTSASGLYLGETYLGYYNGSAWKTYMSNAGNFYLSGGGTNGLSWDGTTLSITGNITVSGGNAATTTQVSTAQTTADNAATAASNAATAASNAQTTANGKISAGGAASDVNSNSTTISGGKIRTGIIESTGYGYTSGNFSDAGTQINLDNGLIRSKNFSIDSSGNAFFKGDVSGASGTFGGSISIGSGNSIFKADSNGIYLGNSTFNSAPFRVTPGGSLSATNASLTGQITATGGTLGGWVIDGNILRDSASRLQLNPGAPSMDIFDSGGAKRLTVKYGGLTSPWSGDTAYIDPPGHSFSTQTLSVGYNTNTIRSSGYNTFYVNAAGTYYAASYTSATVYSAIQTSGIFNGYVDMSHYFVITDNSGNFIQSMGGAYGGTSSPSDTQNLTGYGSAVYVTFPAAGTYRVYSEYSYDAYLYAGNAYVQGSADDPAVNTSIQLDIAEVSNDGFQVISSADSYCRIQRGSSYAIEAKGSMNIAAPAGYYIYLNGLVHPMVGNTNDLGTTGNRWKTVWTNNALNSTSDERLKNSIEDTDLGLDFVNRLRPVKYKNNSASSPRYHYGLIAQELIGTLNDFNKTTSDVGFVASASFQYTEEDIENWKTKPDWNVYESEISASMKGELGLAYTELISPMIKAIQELTSKVASLEARLSGSI